MAINVEGFKLICQAQYKDLYKWLTQQMESYYGKAKVVATGDYLFCEGDFPTMLCAHLDTVHREQVREFVYDETAGTMTSPQGIGGDDRCGVYAVLKILKDLEAAGMKNKPFLFFSTDEETGGASTVKAAAEVKMRVRGVGYLIELDRQGTDDSVYYNCGNKDFKKWIDSFGFKEAHGSRTDICTLCKAWDLAGVNFSVGYMKNHTVSEVVTFADLEKTIERTKNVIMASKPDVIYPYVEKKDTYAGGYNSNYKGGSGSSLVGAGKGTSGLPIVLVGERVEAYCDCIGFQFTSDKHDRVNKYINIPSYTPMTVKSIKGEDLCVTLNAEEVWIAREDVRITPYAK